MALTELPTVADLFHGDDRDWQAQGVCRHPRYTVDDFFLEGSYEKNSGEYRAARDRAKAACGVCPVKQDCLDFAMRNDERDGIWGGLTYAERRALKYGKRPKAATPPVAPIDDFPPGTVAVTVAASTTHRVVGVAAKW